MIVTLSFLLPSMLLALVSCAQSVRRAEGIWSQVSLGRSRR